MKDNTEQPVNKNKNYWEGFKFACLLIDEMYTSIHNHPYLIGDCALVKVNKLSKNKVRKNPNYKEQPKNYKL